jgi:hypothetical protein
MNKRDAARLRPGTQILFRNTGRTQTASNWWVGEVVRTTEGGGVLVRVTKARDGGWDKPAGRGSLVGTQQWVPYHHIHGKHP